MTTLIDVINIQKCCDPGVIVHYTLMAHSGYGFIENIRFPITQITSSDDVILTQMSNLSQSLVQR